MLIFQYIKQNYTKNKQKNDKGDIFCLFSLKKCGRLIMHYKDYWVYNDSY